jgi:hypothetical protein
LNQVNGRYLSTVILYVDRALPIENRVHCVYIIPYTNEVMSIAYSFMKPLPSLLSMTKIDSLDKGATAFLHPATYLLLPVVAYANEQQYDLIYQLPILRLCPDGTSLRSDGCCHIICRFPFPNLLILFQMLRHIHFEF